MSSWVHDWEAALIPRVNGVKAKEIARCKLGRHPMLTGSAMVWLTAPMGLSCLDCAREVDPVAVAAEEARLARPKKTVPAARRGQGRTHGKPGTYAAGCRCKGPGSCTEAATEAQNRYRANRRARRAAELTEAQS